MLPEVMLAGACKVLESCDIVSSIDFPLLEPLCDTESPISCISDIPETDLASVDVILLELVGVMSPSVDNPFLDNEGVPFFESASVEVKFVLESSLVELSLESCRESNRESLSILMSDLECFVSSTEASIEGFSRFVDGVLLIAPSMVIIEVASV
jgi:hypothetical protein